jgi:anti-sigma factor RsiW
MDETAVCEAYSCVAQHISMDVLELYVLGQISPADGDAVDEHLGTCEECCHLIAQAQWSTSLIAAAVGRAAGLMAIHATPDGAVLLMVRKHTDRWVARLRGPSVEGGSFVESAAAGRAWCHDSFVSRFPEHVCTPDCRVYHDPAD